jgi:hypothetical protein
MDASELQKSWMCENGHELKKVAVGERNSGSGFKYHDCDGCQIEVRGLKTIFRCGECNFDLCLKCFTSRQTDPAKAEHTAKKDNLKERQQALRQGLHEIKIKELTAAPPRISGDHIYSEDFYDSLPMKERKKLKSEGKRRRRENKGSGSSGAPPAPPPSGGRNQEKQATA